MYTFLSRFRLILLGSLLWTGCSGDSLGEGRDGGSTDGESLPSADGSLDAMASSDAMSLDASSTVDAAVDGVVVEWPREMRGVWIATVNNINWPSRPGLDAATQQRELIAQLDVAKRVGLNTIFFQVRPESDALYRSELEPWSRYLSGTQGSDPGWDPLSFAIEECHARGLELHAWLNPYRAKASASSTAVAPHPSRTLSQYARTYGNFVWMDPGAAPVQEHTLAVISDILTRYDVDGLHFDDYFYPYPTGDEFPDTDTYRAYTADGGTLSRDDWRRDNVNSLIERIAAIVAQTRSDVRFGISPFGIYRPGMPQGIRGLDQYAAIYADPPLWMERGWVDYLAPQLYWPSTQTAQAYQPLVEWWGALAYDGHTIIPGNFLSKLGSDSSWSLNELLTQVRLTRATPGTAGNIYFQIAPFVANTMGAADAFRDELYSEPALTPPLASAWGDSLAPPSVTVTETGITVDHAVPLRAVALYRDQGGETAPDRILPAGNLPLAVDLEPGSWVVAAVDRRSVLSLGVRVER